MPPKRGRGRPPKRRLEQESNTNIDKGEVIHIDEANMFHSICLPTLFFSDSQPPTKKLRVRSFDRTTTPPTSDQEEHNDGNDDHTSLHDTTLDFDDDEPILYTTTTVAESSTTRTTTDESDTKSKSASIEKSDEPKQPLSALAAKRARIAEAEAAKVKTEATASASATNTTTTTAPAQPVSAAAARRARIAEAEAAKAKTPTTASAANTITTTVAAEPVSAAAARRARKEAAAKATSISISSDSSDTSVKAMPSRLAKKVVELATAAPISALAARKLKQVAEESKAHSPSSTAENQQATTTDSSDRVPGKIFSSPPPSSPASKTLSDLEDIDDTDEFATPTGQLEETALENEGQERVSSWKSEEKKRKEKANKLMDPYSVSTYSSDNAIPFQHEDETYYCIGFEKGQQLVFIGYSLIGVLYGSVDIGGATISSSDKAPTEQLDASESGKRTVSFFPVFSPRTSALTVVRSIPHAKTATVSPSTTLDSVYSDVKPLLEPYLPRLDTLESIIIVKNMEWCGVDQLELINPSLKNLFRLDSKKYHVLNEGHLYEDMVGFQPIVTVTPEVRAMKIEPSWSTCMDSIINFEQESSGPSVSMVCGTKNVGKSSFARFMINRLLKIHQRVAYLETDVGQTEFTPSGLVSLHIVESPLLGSPFTHLHLKSKRSFFIGSTSPKHDSIYYQDCIHQLLETYRKEAEATGTSSSNNIDNEDFSQHQLLPLVVNTCGWLKGLGFDLLLDIAADVAPTHIFTFGGDQDGRTLPEGFQHQIVQAARQSSYPNFRPVAVFPIPAPTMTTTTSQSVSPSSSQQRHRRPTTMADRYQPADHRNLMLISYMYHDAQVFGTRQQGRSWWNVNPRLVDRLPWTIDWRHDLHGVWVLFEDVPPSKLLYALNGALVGLIGKIDNKPPPPPPVAAATSDDKVENEFSEIEDAIAAQQASTVVEEASQSRSKPEIPIKYHSPMTNAPPNPLTTTCYGLGIIRAIDPEKHCFHLLTPLPLDQLCHVNALVKGDLDIPVHLLLDQNVGARNQNCGVPWRQVPYLSHDVIDSIGSSAPRPRRNLMRRSHRIG